MAKIHHRALASIVNIIGFHRALVVYQRRCVFNSSASLSKETEIGRRLPVYRSESSAPDTPHVGLDPFVYLSFFRKSLEPVL